MPIERWFKGLRGMLQTVGAARVAWDLFQSALPWLMAAGVGVPAWFDPDVPWYLALLLFGVSGAVFTLWGNQIRQSRLFGSPEHRVVPGPVALIRHPKEQEYFSLVIQILNTSEFLVDISLLKVHCEIDGDKGKWLSEVTNKEAQVSPKFNSNLNATAYLLKVSPSQQGGKLHLKYEYGEPGKRKFTYEQYAQLAFFYKDAEQQIIEVNGNPIEPFEII